MTYNVFGGTLNLTQPTNQARSDLFADFSVHRLFGLHSRDDIFWPNTRVVAEYDVQSGSIHDVNDVVLQRKTRVTRLSNTGKQVGARNERA